MGKNAVYLQLAGKKMQKKLQIFEIKMEAQAAAPPSEEEWKKMILESKQSKDESYQLNLLLDRILRSDVNHKFLEECVPKDPAREAKTKMLQVLKLLEEQVSIQSYCIEEMERRKMDEYGDIKYSELVSRRDYCLAQKYTLEDYVSTERGAQMNFGDYWNEEQKYVPIREECNSDGSRRLTGFSSHDIPKSPMRSWEHFAGSRIGSLGKWLLEYIQNLPFEKLLQDRIFYATNAGIQMILPEESLSTTDNFGLSFLKEVSRVSRLSLMVYYFPNHILAYYTPNLENSEMAINSATYPLVKGIFESGMERYLAQSGRGGLQKIEFLSRPYNYNPECILTLNQNDKFDIQFNSVDHRPKQVDVKVQEPSELVKQRKYYEPLFVKIKKQLTQLTPEDLREELFLYINIDGFTKYRRFALPSLSDNFYFSILHELSRISSASLLVCYNYIHSASVYYIPSGARLTGPNKYELAPIFEKIKKNITSNEIGENKPHLFEVYEAYTFLPVCSLIRNDTGEILCYCKD